MPNNLDLSDTEAPPPVDTSGCAARDRVLGSLLPGVAHALNNILASLTGWAEVLTSMPADDLGPHRTRLDDLLVEARRCGRLVENVLTFVRATDGSAHVPVGEVIDTALSVLAYDLRKADIEVEVSIDDGIPLPAMPRSALQEVVVALVRNAIAASEDLPDRRLEVCVTPSGGGLAVAVEDHGPGIESATARAALEPPLPERCLEDGLGLATCAHTLGAHGGAIQIQSGGDGARVVAHVPGTPVAAWCD